MKYIYMIPACLFVLVSFTACQKDPVDNLDGDEALVYITNHDPAIDFTGYATFSIADSVAVISNNQFIGRERTALDANLVEAVVSNMEARGYMRTAVNNNPDLGITITRIYNDYAQVVDYGYYWDYYDVYWDPYYWGYPGYSYYYPSFYGVYNITDGAVEIDMFDLKNASANNNQLKYVWNGMIRGSGTFNPGNAQKAAKALFDQSAYLNGN